MDGKGDIIYKCIFVKVIFMISMFYCWLYIKLGDIVILFLKFIFNNVM